jgi:hypothetical protein
VLKNILERIDSLSPTIERLVLFERGNRAGMGMPYHPATTDRYNLCNISSEELPALQMSLADWLRTRSNDSLARFGMRREDISASETYARLALGEYFESQFHEVVQQLREHGLPIELRLNTPVTDLRDDAERGYVIVSSHFGEEVFDRVVIATGHAFNQTDVSEEGYYASPWPIQKLLPRSGCFHNTIIGTLGASLSAFDVVTSLAHRHGRFEDAGGHLRFVPHAGADRFRIVMHSSKGWLPHLQYEQCRPFREVYRYIDRKFLLAMRDDDGFLRLGAYFDTVCRPVLSKAFEQDRRRDIATKLCDLSYTMENFVGDMSAEHEYRDAFEGMKKEYPQARRSIREDQPIHWKESLDDLMYTLSYHADLMPAEDHLRFHSTMMSFLMNVIAAMPLSSAQILLALHDAGRLELKAGRATINTTRDGETVVEVENDAGIKDTINYRMFVDCTGQPGITLDEFPFPTLVTQGAVRSARAKFVNPDTARVILDKSPDHRIGDENCPAYRLDGIDVDAAYRVIGSDGRANSRIFDVAFPHTTGLRPYCYGLQACNHTAGVMVEAWNVEAESGNPPSSRTATLTQLHDNVANET